MYKNVHVRRYFLSTSILFYQSVTSLAGGDGHVEYVLDAQASPVALPSDVTSHNGTEDWYPANFASISTLHVHVNLGWVRSLIERRSAFLVRGACIVTDATSTHH